MVKTKQQLVTSRALTYPGINGCNYITIHETANYEPGADAQSHANLQSNGYSATWHWQVDDKQAIQSFPHTVRCWHAGDGTGKGNYESIGIEICVNADGDFKKAIQNAAELTKIIMQQENISLSNVVQHSKWSSKDCPHNLRNGSKGINWSQFISLVSDGTSTYTPPKQETKQETVTKPKANLTIDGSWGPEVTKALQQYFGTTVDGVISGQPNNANTRNIPSVKFGTSGSNVVKALQTFVGTPQDRKISNPSKMIRALQKRFGTPQDGVISYPSLMVKELQRRLNKGRL